MCANFPNTMKIQKHHILKSWSPKITKITSPPSPRIQNRNETIPQPSVELIWHSCVGRLITAVCVCVCLDSENWWMDGRIPLVWLWASAAPVSWPRPRWTQQHPGALSPLSLWGPLGPPTLNLRGWANKVNMTLIFKSLTLLIYNPCTWKEQTHGMTWQNTFK